MTSSTSAVAVTPSGGRPTSSPTSAPALAGLQANAPPSSSRGWASTPRTAALATAPVVHCTTRIAIPSPLDRMRTPYVGNVRRPTNEVKPLSEALPDDRLEDGQLRAPTGHVAQG